jgi:hypothetical protein
MGIRVLTTLLDSRSLVIGCVLVVFSDTAPFAYVSSVMLSSGCTNSVLTGCLIWRALLVRFSVGSSRFASVGFCNAGFHTDWKGF